MHSPSIRRTVALRGAAGGVVMIALARALAARLGVEVLLVGHPTPLRAGHADALAQARPVLLDYSTQLSASRVLQERYGAYLRIS